MYKIAKQEYSVCFHCKTPIKIAEENKSFPMIFKYVTSNNVKNDLYPYMVYDVLHNTSEKEFVKYFPNIPLPKKLCNKFALISGIPMRLDSISAITNKPEPNEITTAYSLLLKITLEGGSDFDMSPTSELTEDIKKRVDAVLYLIYNIVNGKFSNIGLEYSKNELITNIKAFMDRKLNNGISKISGKEQDIRARILAKRVNNIGRLVSTCNNELDFGTIMLPENLLKNLYISERYNKFNMLRLNKYYINGISKYPGAEYIICAENNSKLYCEEVNKTYVPQVGDILSRNVGPGDLVNVGRAPTLMPSNISTYKIVDTLNTYGDSISIKSSEYKKLKDGDFDGDESSVSAARYKWHG